MGTVANNQPWSTGLCDCFSDCGILCCGFWCHPCLYGRNAAKIEQRDSCCVNCCLYFLLHYFCMHACLAKGKRQDLRQRYGLAPATCGDCCAYCFCGACAVCQDARELKYREAMGANAQFATSATAPPPAQQMHYYPPPPQV